MAIYTSTALKQRHGEILAATDQQPVIITRHNRKRYILMTVEFYKQSFVKPSTSLEPTTSNNKCPDLDKVLAEFQTLDMKGRSGQSHETSKLPEPKTMLTMRVDKAILDFFKSTGRGYQSRINAVLRAFKDAPSVPKSD